MLHKEYERFLKTIAFLKTVNTYSEQLPDRAEEGNKSASKNIVLNRLYTETTDFEADNAADSRGTERMTARERECANGYVRDPSWAPEEGGKWGPKQCGELTNAPDATQSDRATAVGNAITGPAYRYIFSHLPWLPPRVGGVQPALKVAGRRHPAPNKRRRGANSTPTVNARAQQAADRAAEKRKREDELLSLQVRSHGGRLGR